MGCLFRRGDQDVELPSQQTLAADARTSSFFIHKKSDGIWQQRLAVITTAGFLAVYKTLQKGKIYDLQNLDSFRLKYRGNGIRIYLKTASGKKLTFRLMGPGAKIIAGKIMNYERVPLGHDGHKTEIPKSSAAWENPPELDRKDTESSSDSEKTEREMRKPAGLSEVDVLHNMIHANNRFDERSKERFDESLLLVSSSASSDMNNSFDSIICVDWFPNDEEEPMEEKAK